MIERALVYVDTSYLLASFYNSWEEGARGQLEISLAQVVHTLNRYAGQQAGVPVQRQFWYDGISDAGPQRYQRTLRVIEGVQLRAGQLIEWGDRRTQKAVDTLLVADMVRAAITRQCTDMVLVSGDADMIPGVTEAVDAGIRVHLIGFGLDSIASSLRHRCDTATVLDPREDFADAMQLRVLEGPVPPQVRTPGPRHVAPGEEPHDEVVEGIDVVGADLREDRPTARTVADEAAQSAADEELAHAGDDFEAHPGQPPLGDEAARRSEAGERRNGAERIGSHAGAEAADAGSKNTGAHGAGAHGAGAENPAADPPSVSGSTTEAGGAERAAMTDSRDAGTASDAGAPPGGATHDGGGQDEDGGDQPAPARPNPSMMAPKRRPLRSKYVPLSDEVWTSSGEATPFDVGQQYATWWYEQSASEEQKEQAHLLSGGPLPPHVDRPLLQFACQMLNEFTLTEYQRVSLRDGFHEGIRAVLVRNR